MIHLGAHFVAPWFGAWSQQREMFRRMRSQIGKICIPIGFGFGPGHVQDLITDGAHTIILRTQDCDIGWERTQSDFVGRGFREVVLRNPDIRFVLEVGNEPENCQSKYDPFKGISYYIEQAREVGRNFHTIDVPNLDLILSSPVRYDNYISVINAPDLMHYYDGFGVHLYGHHRLDDGGDGDWVRIFEDARERGVNLWLTELGINDPSMSKSEKGRRILEYLQELLSRRITRRQLLGAVVFTVGFGTSWPQYEVNTAMAQELAQRDQQVGEFYHQTGKYLSPLFHDYFHANGGVRQFGYPVSNQMSEDGMPVQYFERNVMEYHDDNPPDWKILLRRLGAKEFNRRYR